MSTKRIERRLVAIGDRLSSLRAEAAICLEQLDQVAAEADDARLRALVSDRPLERHEHHDAQRSADTLRRRHQRVAAKIADLEARQDELLDALTSRGD